MGKYKVEKSKRSRLPLVIIIIIGLIGVGFAYWHDTNQSKQALASLADSLRAQGIDTAEVTNEQKDSYQVDDPIKPKLLTIPTANVNRARIHEIGYVRGSTQIDVPKNINDIGWFNCKLTNGRTDLPQCSDFITPTTDLNDDNLAMVMDAHMCHGLVCAFNNLASVKQGDTIEVTTGNDEKFTYTVHEVEIVDVANVNMDKVMHSYAEGEHGLNLISCLGNPTRVDQLGNTTYDKRVIVYSTMVK